MSFAFPSLLAENAGRALLLRAGQSPLEPRTDTVPDRNADRKRATPIRLVGSRVKSAPPDTWTESGQTPILKEVV
jgi:hypothetical protein